MKFLVKAIKIILLFSIAIFVFGSVVMWLWNWLVPDLFNGPEISFIQALGLLVLARILTGGMGHGCRRRKGSCYPRSKKSWQKKWEELPEDKKEKIRKKMTRFCESDWAGPSDGPNTEESKVDSPSDEG